MSDPHIFPVSQLIEPWENPVRDPQNPTQRAVGVPLAALPPGYTLADLKPFLEAYRARPERRSGHYRVAARSFVELVNRFRNNDTTAIFVNRCFMWYRITAVFDWHPSGPDQRQTGNCGFRATTWARAWEPLTKPTGLLVFFGFEP